MKIFMPVSSTRPVESILKSKTTLRIYPAHPLSMAVYRELAQTNMPKIIVMQTVYILVYVIKIGFFSHINTLEFLININNLHHYS